MLRKTKELEAFTLSASDGEIGKITDCYFDDAQWVIRYLVVDTGDWLSSRKVLISPAAIGNRAWWGERSLPIDLTRAQIEACPDIDSEQPVSRQQERIMLQHFGYPYYWSGRGLWGGGLYPYQISPGMVAFANTPALYGQADSDDFDASVSGHRDDPHLRSCNEVIGYHIHAKDGEIGHVQGFLMDDQTWALRYLVVNTSNWWLGHEVLIAPAWIKAVDWSDNTVSIDLSREAIMASPVYDSTTDLVREQESGVHHHYGHVGYWIAEDKPAA